MKRIIAVGYKDGAVKNVYDLPYQKTKKGYFLLIINEKIDELLLSCDTVTLKVKGMMEEQWTVNGERRAVNAFNKFIKLFL